MTRDNNKGITSVTYNHLNQPVEVVLSGKRTKYTYTATGLKLKTEVYENDNLKSVTEYIGAFVYEDAKLSYINIPDGRYVIATGKYEYNLTDHLGNVRVTFTKGSDNKATIIEEDHYYPFGLQMSGQHFQNTDFLNKYLYNGKEKQDQTGWFDYGFRQLDPQLGRWHVVDALAEKFADESPYNYAGNNPISNIDVMGLQKQALDPQKLWDMCPANGVSEWTPGGGYKSYDSYDNYQNGISNQDLESYTTYSIYHPRLGYIKGQHHNKVRYFFHWLFNYWSIKEGVGSRKVEPHSDDWNPSDPNKGHFAPDLKTLVNYMYENSPKEKREFTAWVLEKDGDEYYYLENRDDSSPCECWPTYSRDKGGVALDSDGDGILEKFNIIVGIHTHNSCLKSNGYQGPSDEDYEAAQDFKANIIIIGDTEISFLNYLDIYNTPDYFYHLRDQEGPLFENPFKEDYTHDWLLNPTYNY